MNPPHELLYLSRATLEGLEIAPQEAAESIEHLIRGRERSQVWSAPKMELSVRHSMGELRIDG